MTRIKFTALTRPFLFLAAAGIALSADGTEPQQNTREPPKVVTDNQNTLIKTHRPQLKLSCSTFYRGWPVQKIIDGNPATSWFSATGDAAAQGTKPWVMIQFPEDVTVTRVSVLGNREPTWLKGYTILSGMVEFLDKDGKQLWVDENKGVGNACDFEFTPKKSMAKVRALRFTSLKDEGDQNGYKDIAIGEIMIE